MKCEVSNSIALLIKEVDIAHSHEYDVLIRFNAAITRLVLILIEYNER